MAFEGVLHDLFNTRKTNGFFFHQRTMLFYYMFERHVWTDVRFLLSESYSFVNKKLLGNRSMYIQGTGKSSRRWNAWGQFDPYGHSRWMIVQCGTWECRFWVLSLWTCQKALLTCLCNCFRYRRGWPWNLSCQLWLACLAITVVSAWLICWAGRPSSATCSSSLTSWGRWANSIFLICLFLVIYLFIKLMDSALSVVLGLHIPICKREKYTYWLAWC